MGRIEHREPPDGITRHFTVAVFVVQAGHVLLHPHRKLRMWLPPGGHIEMHELPDDAARREAWEETGLEVELLGGPGLDHQDPGSPRQLVRPEGIQVEDISPGHQHIDLVYLARPVGLSADDPPPQPGPEHGMRWLSAEDVDRLTDPPVTAEIRAWVAHALSRS